MSEIHDRPGVYVLCDDGEQCSLLCSVLQKDFDVIEAGPIGAMTDFKSGSVILLDLSGSTSSNISDVLGSTTPCVINSQNLVDLDELQLTSWRYRVARQLIEPAGAKSHPDSRVSDAVNPTLWVLCASTNGPTTLGEFLQAVPADTGDSFLVLQHIKDSFIKSLREHLMKTTQMLVLASNRSEKLKPNTVYICPPNRTPRVAGGRLLWDKKRSKKFSPCIDECLESLVETLGHKLKVIVFTGMGTDCLRGSRKVADLGGSIWAQSVESATIASMPRSVIEAGVCSEVGTPGELAAHIANA